MSFLLPLGFVILGLLFRVIPHPANFSPIFAIALFGGTYFVNKRLALIIPILALFFSDFFIGFYSPVVMAFVYAGLVLIALLGLWLRNHKSVLSVLGTALASGTLFFLVSNFGVWLNPVSGYAKSAAGLVQCYLLALPFLKTTLVSNLVYTAVLFGGYELTRLALSRKPAQGLA
jgi:hypothetical protein